jgi:predicted RNA-binding Zn-ribbon protein involved in translation (DUF1610 family)
MQVQWLEIEHANQGVSRGVHLWNFERLGGPCSKFVPLRTQPHTENSVDPDSANPKAASDGHQLYAVHLCVSCGNEIRRSEMGAQGVISGVVQCPACGDSGPLNVVIRSLQDKKPPKRSTD